MKPIRRAVRVSGLVQGVSFRYYARRRAVELGLTGWVRNLSDGSVMLEVQGGSEPVEAMLRWSTEGPSQARVDTVRFESRAVEPREPAFVIRH